MDRQRNENQKNPVSLQVRLPPWQPDRRSGRRGPVADERRIGPDDQRRQPRVPVAAQPVYRD